MGRPKSITEQGKDKALPQLVKLSDSSYKLKVPAKVEEKIRYLIRKFPSTEWSGVLFYTHTGTFEGNDLLITCEDIYPMDLGSTGFTEFHMTEEVVSYIADNIELFECEIGLIHSHHTMGAFFSGQDDETLRNEGNETNCFVSLVVDTRGTYVAAITRKLQSTSEITIKTLGKSYEFFGEGPISIVDEEDSPEEIKKTLSKEIIQCFPLKVEREIVSNPLEFLDKRFAEIETKKSTPSSVHYPYMGYGSQGGYINDDYPFEPLNDEDHYGILDENLDIRSRYLREKEEEERAKRKLKEIEVPMEKQLELFKENKDTIYPFEENNTEADFVKDFPYTSGYIPNPEKIHHLVCKMLTCSLALNIDKFNLDKWIDKHMVTNYKKMFEQGEKDEQAEYSKKFKEWCNFVTEFIVFNYSDLNSLEFIEAITNKEDELYSDVAQAMYKELIPYKDKNKYISYYCKTLQTMI